MKLKKRSPASKRRERRRLSALAWRRYVPLEYRRLATPCPRCGRIEYWGCVKSCFQNGKWAFEWAVPYRSVFPLVVDGEAVRVHGDPNMPQETKEALAEVVRAVREQYSEAVPA